MDEMCLAGRVYLEVDVDEVEPDDVVEYLSEVADVGKVCERRCHRVDGVRRGKQAAVRIVPHDHEQPARRWYPIRHVLRAWRRRAEFKRRPKA
jgi:hypothetical protein